MKVLRMIISVSLIVIIAFKITNPTFNVNNGLLVENVTIVSTNKDGIIEKYIGHVLIDNETILYSGTQKPIVTGNLKNINGKAAAFLLPCKYPMRSFFLLDASIKLDRLCASNVPVAREKTMC